MIIQEIKNKTNYIDQSSSNTGKKNPCKCYIYIHFRSYVHTAKLQKFED